jgi:hypothetical protein
VAAETAVGGGCEPDEARCGGGGRRAGSKTGQIVVRGDGVLSLSPPGKVVDGSRIIYSEGGTVVVELGFVL